MKVMGAMGSCAQEAVFVHLGRNLGGKRLDSRAERRDAHVVPRIGRIGVHVAIGLESLEMSPDVVERGIGKRIGLRMVVPPEFPPGVEDRAGFRGQRGNGGIVGRLRDIGGQRLVREHFALRRHSGVSGSRFSSVLSAQEIRHEMRGERVCAPHLILRERYPVVHTSLAGNAVLPMEQRVGHAVQLKAPVCLPCVFWPQKLIAVV